MKWLESFGMALKSIASNKIRAGLTMLGIIIGVASVITMVSLVEGSTSQVTAQLESMGTNLISVTINGRGSTRSVSEDELFEFAEKNSDVIEAIAPQISSSVTVKTGNKNIGTTLEGTNEAYRTARNTDVEQGRFLNALDVERRQKVVLIGTYVAQELFGQSTPLGQKIKINGEVFTVVGVLETKSNGTAQSGDDKVIIPYTTAKRLLRNSNIRTFSVQGKTPETVDQAMAVLQDFLYSVFHDSDSYRVFNQADILDSVSQVTGTMTMMLGGIAGISLLVGGIGIMNIMLVSVTERTKEIGIRKAIGAKRRNILQQFLIEAIVVSCIGGIIGILIGMGLSSLIGKFTGIPAQPSLFTTMMSFSFSALVGVFFGWYPANKASKLNPIQALRTE